MNLAEIRKKAGAVKKVDAAAAMLPDALETLEIPEVSDHLESPVTFESYSESPAAVDSFFEEMMPEEMFSEVANEVEEPPEDEATVESEPVLQEFQVVFDAPADQLHQSDARLLPESPAKGIKTSLIDVIVAGRAASSDSEDMLSAQVGDSSTDIEEYLCFRVADEEYAISIMSIKEIIKPRDVTEVPRVPLFIQGVISLRGLIIPVMDMRCRLSLPVVSVTGRERIVVVRKEAGFCGILVDEVVQVARVAKKDIEEPPAVLDGIDKAFVKGLGHYDGRMIILLDLEAILDAGVH
jgi:purine-binding chemotaxis protein CheW